MTFVRLTQEPEGLPVYIRTSRIQAFARTTEGGTRIFLTSAFNCLVAENEDEVLRAIQGADDDR